MKNNDLSGSLLDKKLLTPKESVTSAMVAAYLDRRRIYNDRLNSGKVFTGNRCIMLCKDGTPDRFAILKGIIIFIETKIKDGKPRPNQLARQAELIAAGARVINCDSFDDFVKKFREVEAGL